MTAHPISDCHRCDRSRRGRAGVVLCARGGSRWQQRSAAGSSWCMGALARARAVMAAALNARARTTVHVGAASQPAMAPRGRAGDGSSASTMGACAAGVAAGAPCAGAPTYMCKGRRVPHACPVLACMEMRMHPYSGWWALSHQATRSPAPARWRASCNGCRTASCMTCIVTCSAERCRCGLARSSSISAGGSAACQTRRRRVRRRARRKARR